MELNKVSVLVLLVNLLLSPVLFAGVYKWTDANGKIHFSDKPHKNSAEITIKATKPSGIGASNSQLRRQKELLLQYQNERDVKNKQQRKTDKRNNKIAQYCKRLKNRIRNYDDVDYLYTRNDDGKKNRLSGTEKRKEIQLLKKEYANRCS